LGMLVERQYWISAFGAFVMPVVVVLSLKATAARPATLQQLGDAFHGAWVWVHIALAMIGIAAFVLNFAGALMYLLQERQLKAKRPGAFYYRLPDLQTLDRLTYRTLALRFPFLTTGLILGAVWVLSAERSVLTFNRVEVYAVADAPGEARAAVFRRLCQHRGVDPAAVEPLVYTHVDEEAIRHAFRVAASLDSMMVGEPQILGQVKDAFALAQACETVGPTLHTLFSQAFAVAKKVRT